MTRREFLSGGLASTLAPALLAGCSDIRGRRLDGMDPRVSALLKQGFSPAEASKILGGNYVRVFRQVVAARQAARGARTLARR